MIASMAEFVSALAAPGPYGINPYQPGKPVEELEREYGIQNSIKLASNENPLGPSPLALKALRKAAKKIVSYPDSGGFYLKQKLAQHCQVSPDQLLLGNGSNEVLEIIARAFLTADTSAIMSEYCFTVYPIVTQSAGAQIVTVAAKKWGHDLDAMAAAVQNNSRVVFVANPNNPTGTWVSQSALIGFLEQLPDHLVVVLDEAYIEYNRGTGFADGLKLLARFPRLIVLRTFSKIYGLAGIRVGYGVADPQIIEFLNRVREPFNVNSLALVAAEAALDDGDHLQRSLALNQRGMVQLARGIEQLGLETIPSKGNFLAVDLGRAAVPVYEGMLRRGVIVRPVGNYQMPNHLRITVGRQADNRRCLAALAEALDETSG